MASASTNVTVLDRRHALVTGGARGIGEAIAAALAGRGMRVSIIGRGLDDLKQTHERLALSGGVFAADVTDPVAVNDAAEALRTAHGPIEVLINNAGNAESAPFRSTDRDLWDRMLAVNLTGTYTVTRALWADLTAARSGRIVNIASTAALKGYPYVSAYCAAKHGVLGLTRTLALELAQTGTTVNAICPGFTDTDMLSASIEKIAGATGMNEDEARSDLASVNPQARLIDPDEVAETALWLCSEAARGVTGQAIAVCGGEVM